MSVEKNNVHSMVIAFDGESKCGKTTFTEMVAEEARFQARFYRGEELGDCDPQVRESIKEGVAEWAESINFRNITTISAGNSFRAAAYYVIRQEERGQSVTSFSSSDVDNIRDILTEDGIIDTLQNDVMIGKHVSSVAKLVGAQALCGAIFCDSVREAYNQDGGANLVVIDARDPIGHMHRNNMLGDGPDKIVPASVIPIYIDTPINVAAARMSGMLTDNVRLVTERRMSDATRAELPVVRPDSTAEDYSEWFKELISQTNRQDILAHFLAKNDEDITLDNIQYLASTVAAAAHTIGLQLASDRLNIN